ncbi:MAG: beta-ketoacyl-[acyl-carrier-protein] synthase II [Calditrichaeota bacterium]|nr:MAG: beta-ketoacyl-[acyl-carrier-protein] synthase II [Calditrichota bacterium]
MQRTPSTERIVVTGIGLVTPLGMTVEENWRALMEGKSGISRIQRFDPEKYELTTQFAGEAKNFDPAKFLEKKEVRRYDRFIHFAVAASDLAMEDAGLTIEDLPRDRVGIIVGSGMGGIETFVENTINMHVYGQRKISPFFVPALIANMASGLLTIRYGTRGSNYAIVSACATGAHSIGEGYHTLKRGECDLMIVGGTEAAVTPLGIAGFSAARALSRRNEAPEKASRPFDRDRDGFVMGEGAGIMILERESSARARGARIYAYLEGIGYSSDAYHPTAPCADGAGAALAMKRAIKNAGLRPQDIDYINAHATSTELGDKAEVTAIRSVFGKWVDNVAVSSTKSMTGHLLGAAGSVEAAYAVLALYHQMLPPTINLDNVDPECELNHVANQPRPAQVNFSITNGFGFGGTNTSLVFARA